MKLRYYVALVAVLIAFSTSAQQGPTVVATADSYTYVPSLASRMSELTPSKTKGVAKDQRSLTWKREIVPGKGRQPDII